MAGLVVIAVVVVAGVLALFSASVFRLGARPGGRRARHRRRRVARR